MRPSNFDPSYGDVLGGSVSVAITKLADGRAILKQSVRLATTGAITLATALEAGDTIDGQALAESDRVLVWQQADATENGVYSVAATGAPTRTLDADTGEELLGCYVTILDGTANAGKLFHNVNTIAPVLGTDDVLFEELTLTIPAGTYELAIEGGQSVISAHGAMGATETFDPTAGNVHTGTASADVTFTLSAPVGSGASALELYITQDGTGGWDITWPGSVVWQGGSMPTIDTTAGTLTRYILESLDGGTTWYASVVGSGSGGTPATTVESETTWGITPAVGTDTEYARQDHTHGSPAEPAAGAVGPILITDTPAGSPLVFADLLQTEAGDDLLYADA